MLGKIELSIKGSRVPLESITAFIVASVLLAIVPGPDNIFVLTQSALYGKKSGVLVTLGLCTGLIFHTGAVALGVAAIIQTSIVAFTILKVIGALYLAYLAWQAFRASKTVLAASDSKLRTNGALYRRGIIMNITNPKVSIFFLAFLPQFASQEHGSFAPQMVFLGGIFMCVVLLIFSAISTLAGSLGRWLQDSPRSQVYLNRIAGTVFGLLALKLVASSADAA